jgi:hypothetical protein
MKRKGLLAMHSSQLLRLLQRTIFSFKALMLYWEGQNVASFASVRILRNYLDVAVDG